MMFQELLTCFDAIEEPRQVGKVEHELIDVLAITVCAVLARAETFEDIALYGQHKEKWLRQFLRLPNGIPSHDTFRRVFMLINAERFESCFLAWTRAVLHRQRKTGPAKLPWMARPCGAPLIGVKEALLSMWSARLRHKRG